MHLDSSVSSPFRRHRRLAPSARERSGSGWPGLRILRHRAEGKSAAAGPDWASRRARGLNSCSTTDLAALQGLRRVPPPARELLHLTD